MTFEEKYNILGTKNTQYEGAFITAVKSTGIFCRPSCRARKPNRENVIFYNTSKDAMREGYRPCKICKPINPISETPPYIDQLLEEIETNPYIRLKDQDLRDRYIEPNTLRRWFKKHHNLTFHGYQRLIRLNQAYKDIKKGKSVTDTAYDNGYESLSGFNEGYKSIFGSTASSGDEKNILTFTRFSTPIGAMIACASEEGLCLLEFTDRRMLETEFKDLQKRLNAVLLPGEHKILSQTKDELQEYFEGTRTSFTVPLNYPGTEFQKTVWEELLKIPIGSTKSYRDQAIACGNIRAIRAVASANGMNRIAIIIPCHRVIGSDGSLTGYAGGLERKRWLLDHEQKLSNGSFQAKIDF